MEDLIKSVICKKCLSNWGHLIIKHGINGCGLVNDEKSEIPHLHFYCNKCNTDYIYRELTSAEVISNNSCVGNPADTSSYDLDSSRHGKYKRNLEGVKV
jgi:hypothetical protein